MFFYIYNKFLLSVYYVLVFEDIVVNKISEIYVYMEV